MGKLLKAALMVLGAGCVLLLAGGFPLVGAPAVYRGGAMLLTGAAAGLLCLWGGWRLSKGVRARFLCGLVCTFFASAGAGGVWIFGAQGVENASMGGAMWFGALAMFCLAAVGLIFLGVFGFLAWRAMYRRLWLAAVHWALALMVLGAFMDYYGEMTAKMRLIPDNGQQVHEVEVCDVSHTLGFSLSVEKFDITYYPAEHYTLYRWVDNRWQPGGKPEVQGGDIVLGDRRWPVSELRTSSNMPRPYLLAGSQDAVELVMQDAPAVRDYCATCRVTSDYRGREESRTVEIRVNKPLSFKGWEVYLDSWRPMGDTVLVEMTARHAPGRLSALGGMVGLLISTACWCWKRREDEPAEAAAQQSTPA